MARRGPEPYLYLFSDDLTGGIHASRPPFPGGCEYIFIADYCSLNFIDQAAAVAREASKDRVLGVLQC